jgi:glucose/mannose-6-phosphate isomerase
MTTSAPPSQLDSADMHGAIGSLPDQLRSAYSAASSALDGTSLQTPRALVVCGMGGSGVGGDLLAATADLSVPVVGVKGYDIPAWVGSDDLVVCVSYSGNTAETLACANAAHDAGAPIVAITSGGKIGGLAEGWNAPIVPVQSGMQPRAAVGQLYASLVAVAERASALRDAEELLTEAAAGAQLVVDEHSELSNEEAPAAVLARSLEGYLVVVYGAGPTAAVAGRWKAQINENAKLPAYSNTYPELDHNEIVGWQFARATGARWAVVELVGPGERSENTARMEATMALVADSVDAHRRIHARTASRAGGVFELTALGDYLSLHLALLRGIDPSPVERIESLKERLGGK